MSDLWPGEHAEEARRRLTPWKVVAVYAAAVGGWVIFSDSLVNALGMPVLHTFKGLAFVAVSSLLLLLYLRRKAAHQRAIEQVLQAAADTKTRLISAVSHDLRQPLQSITLFALVIQKDANLGAQSRTALEKLLQSVQRMGQLLDSVLRLAKIDVGLVDGRTGPVPLNQLFSELVQEMAPQAEAKGLALKRVPTSAIVESDPILLLTILRNLVANAIRYTDEGRVLVGCRRRGETYEISIYDTGIGIDEDKLKLVFEEFYQIGNSARDSRLGLGLGLSIVERLSKVLGHKVVVRSEKGRGSAFCVVVPRSEQSGG